MSDLFQVSTVLYPYFGLSAPCCLASTSGLALWRLVYADSNDRAVFLPSNSVPCILIFPQYQAKLGPRTPLLIGGQADVGHFDFLGQPWR